MNMRVAEAEVCCGASFTLWFTPKLLSNLAGFCKVLGLSPELSSAVLEQQDGRWCIADERIVVQITELIHVASLLHDDVVDSASMRRGLKALNVTFGNKASNFHRSALMETQACTSVILSAPLFLHQACTARQQHNSLDMA